MKEERKVTSHMRIIQVPRENPAEFQRQYNKVSAELAKFTPDKTHMHNDKYFTTMFTYDEVEVKMIPQSLKEEFELAGMAKCCGACPHLEIGHNKARKTWPCPFSKYGQSRIDDSACEIFYKELAAGLAKPREPEEEI